MKLDKGLRIPASREEKVGEAVVVNRLYRWQETR